MVIEAGSELDPSACGSLSRIECQRRHFKGCPMQAELGRLAGTWIRRRARCCMPVAANLGDIAGQGAGAPGLRPANTPPAHEGRGWMNRLITDVWGGTG